ncbi:MAG: T9SS type A sorting domain-containing protein, partial [Bacteroidota bacterium]
AIDQNEVVVTAASATLAADFGGKNTIGATGIASISRTPNSMLDPRIDAGGAALGGGTPSDDPFFNLVTYRGAFGNSVNWLSGWTALNDMNYLGDEVEPINTFDCTVVRDGDLLAGQTYNWGGGNCYTLDGLVYLEADGVLNIEAGTVIRGLGANDVSTGDNTSALIITRDATINATGTAEEPIIFTAAEDDLNDPSDFTSADRGEWGGLILLGNATIATTGGEDGIEGIDASEERAKFGGNDDGDSSGKLNYVSIRHGGAVLSDGDEINGLTLGGVGSGTEIDYVEVFANDDDGIEWFGGTVDVKHAVVSFCKDDGMDYDYGWRGRGQFWFVIQEPNTTTGHAGEHDGASPDDFAPFSNPVIYNATYIGIGNGATASGGDAAESPVDAVLMRDNTGGTYANSIFTGYNGSAISVEDRTDTDTGDSYARFEAGDLTFTGNIFEDFQAGDTPADLFLAIDQNEVVVTATSATLAADFGGKNTIGATGIASISRMPNNMLDPRIDAGGEALFGGQPSDDPFFNLVTYRGAFGNTVNWMESWTALSDMNYLGDEVEPVNTFDCVTVTDGDLVGGQTYTWDQPCYTLDGLVYLEADGVLNINPGVVVRGLGANDVSTGDNTSALIITRDAQIFANGTAAEPIIFTAAEDDLEDATDFTAADRGEWGGLILLGNATIATTGGEDGIEGIDASEERAKFGGNDDMDNSGKLNYVSIRHGGAVLSDGDEINGLTLGGVGSLTEIDYVEVFANDDDGIEWFGGTVNVSHAAVGFCKDDAMDYDYGWRGNGQFWFTIQAPNTTTGHAGEHDGASPDDFAPFSNPTIYNATYVGIGNGQTATGGDAAESPIKAILMRDNTGGSYNNSIFTDFNGLAVAIEDRDDTDTGDAYARLQDGDLSFNNNFFWNFGAGDMPADLFVAVDQNEVVNMTSSAVVVTNFTDAGNQIADPVLNNPTRDADGYGMDPRPNLAGPASFGAPDPVGDYFTDVDYYGAFAPGNGAGDDQAWIIDWTAIAVAEAIDFDFVNSLGQVEKNGLLLDAPVPNPATDEARINFELPNTMDVEITVLDITGRPVAFRASRFAAGPQSETINVTNLPNGTYVVVLRAAGSRLLQKLVVNK